MKVEIIRTNVNCETLYRNIREFEISTLQTAYLFMNKDTLKCLEDICHKNKYWYGYSLYKENSSCGIIANFTGNKIFLDDDLRFGEVEIR